MGTLNRKIARRYGKAIDLNNFKADGSLETGAPSIYDSAGLLPTSGVANGTQAYVTANQKLYIRATGGWYNVATVNTTPTISSVADASSNTSPFILATDGSTTTVVTVTATDSEGFPLTFSAVANSGFNGLATVAQDSSVFTITPKSEDSATTTEGTLTFRASDGVNIASEISTFTLTFKIDNSRFTEFLVKASGNNGTNTSVPTDGSSNSATLTTPGNDPTNQAWTAHHPRGYSFEVKGNTDAISIDSGYFTTNNTWWKSSGFTMEGWVNLTATNNTAIWDNRTSGTSGWMLNYNNANKKPSFYSNGSYSTAFSSDIPRDGKWHYIALTVSGTSANIYIDGVKDATTASVANTATYQYFGKATNTLGAVQYTPRQSNACQGKYRDFKFTAGVQYTGATMAVPTVRKNSDSDTALFVTMSPCLRDLSSNASVVGVLGSTYDLTQSTPYDHPVYNPATHGSSMYHESKQYYVRIPQFRGGTTSYSGEFTYEGWFYFTQYDGFGNDVIFTDGHENGSNRGPFWYNNAYYMVLASTPGDWSAANAKSFGTIKKGWYHLALVRDGDTLRPFVNGIQGTTTTLSSNAALNFPNLDLLIASSFESWVSTAAFYLSEFRLVWGSALYTSNFTVPTEPLNAVTNTQVLVQPAAPNVYNAASRNRLTLGGDAKSSTAIKKYAGASILLDGSGDFITIEDGTNLDFGSEPFTMEGWYKADTTSGDHYIISSSGGTYNAGPSHFGVNIYQGNWRVGGFNDKLIGGIGSGVNTGIDTNWHHFAWTHNHRVIQFFIDGAQVGNTVAVGSDTFDCGGNFIIGGYHSNTGYGNWDGNLEDIRITKGFSRYPFVRAKETLTAVSGTSFLTAHAASITDGSSNSISITSQGDPTVSDFAPAPGMKSVLFDGNDYLQMADGDYKTFGSNDFTIEAWVYPTSVGSGFGNYIWGDTASSGATNTSSTAVGYFSSGKFGAYITVAGPTILDMSSSSLTTPINNWYHVALVRNGNTFSLFIDGVLSNSATNSNAVLDSSQILTVGRTGAYSGLNFVGYVSNYRIVKGTALYTNSFTPSTTELKA